MTTKTLTATAVTRALRPIWPDPARLTSKIVDDTVQVTLPNRPANMLSYTTLIARKLEELTGRPWIRTDLHEWKRADTGSWARLTFAIDTVDPAPDGDQAVTLYDAMSGAPVRVTEPAPLPPRVSDVDPGDLAPVRIGRSKTVHVSRPAHTHSTGNPLCPIGSRLTQQGMQVFGTIVDEPVTCTTCIKRFPGEIAAMTRINDAKESGRPFVLTATDVIVGDLVENYDGSDRVRVEETNDDGSLVIAYVDGRERTPGVPGSRGAIVLATTLAEGALVRVPSIAEGAARLALRHAKAAADQAHDEYLSAIQADRFGGIEADASGEANVMVARAELALDIAAGRIAPGTVHFYRVDVSGDGTNWERIHWGRSDAADGETPDAHAARIAEAHKVTGQLMSPKRWRIQVWTDPTGGQAHDGEWSRDAVSASDLDARAKDGPIEVRTEDGWWPLFAGTTSCSYGRTLIRVVGDEGEQAYLTQAEATVDVRPAAAAPADPRRTAPKAGESRVIAGYLLHRYIGWQWLTGNGWETVTGARQGRFGKWIVATDSSSDWCEPENHFTTIRPVVDPTDRVLRTTIVGSGCCCELWPDNPFDPSGETDTVYARYPGPACPAHPTPVPAPLPGGRSVRVAGGVPVSDKDQRSMEHPVPVAHDGRIIRTWMNEADGQRWYEVSMEHSGQVVSRPAGHLTEIPDLGWDPLIGEFPVIFEVTTHLSDGRWDHETAGFSCAGNYDTATLTGVAWFMAIDYARRTRHPVRVTVAPAREEHRQLHPDDIGYATAEPGSCDAAATTAA